MREPALIVCERSGLWAAAIGRCLPVEIAMRQTRSLAECAAELAAAPESLLALELSRQNVAGILALLSSLGRQYPSAAALVLAERGWESYEWLLREAGTMHFTTSPRQPDELVRLVAGHISRQSAPQQNFAAQIWDALPWSPSPRS